MYIVNIDERIILHIAHMHIHKVIILIVLIRVFYTHMYNRMVVKNNFEVYEDYVETL